MIEEKNLYDIQNTHVFLRADMDVSLVEGKIESDYRIRKCIDTIKILKENNNKIVVFTKLGRPEHQEPSLSTKNILSRLKELLHEHILLIRNLDELGMLDKTTEQIFLFENTRFFEWEDIDDPNAKITAQKLSRFFEFYVDEAFAMSHRTETSNYLVPKFIGHFCLGKTYKQEIDTLTKIKEGNFSRPAIFLLGGAKVETKLPMVKSLKDKFDNFILGGLMPKEISQNPSIIEEIQNKTEVAELEEHGFDITERSTNEIVEKLKKSKTIVWNGPTGMFENDKYKRSTVNIIKALKEINATKIIGGGDTITAVEKFGKLDDYTFVSTGGGAMFSYLSGNKTNIEKLIYEEA